MLTFIEKNPIIQAKDIEKMKRACADNAQIFFEQPTEDIFLMVDNIVKELGKQ